MIKLGERGKYSHFMVVNKFGCINVKEMSNSQLKGYYRNTQ